jgi:hypothetical protein
MRQGALAVTIGVGMAVLAAVLAGGALHSLMEVGTCSTTGFSSQVGPVPQCPSGSTEQDIFLPASLLLSILVGLTPLGLWGLAALFTGVGVGPLLLELGSGPKGVSDGFLVAFGGAFLVCGLGIAIGLLVRQASDGWPRVAALSGFSAVAAAAVGAGAGLGLVNITAPVLPTAKQLAAAQPKPAGEACRILPKAIATEILGPQAQFVDDQPTGTGDPQCQYANGAGDYLTVITGTWAELSPGAFEHPQPVADLGTQAFYWQGILTVRKGAKGANISFSSKQGTAASELPIAERAARAILPLI